MVLWCGLKLVTMYTDSEPPVRYKTKLPPVPCLGPPGMSFNLFCRWLLLVLGLKVPERGQAVN